MGPKKYYYSRFRHQFNEFAQKANPHYHPREGIFIAIQALNKNNLSHIPSEDYMFFHCALSGTILIDQLMHSHFKADYEKFHGITFYPKFEYGLSGVMVEPWRITHSGIGLTTFEKFMEFFISDLQEFFDTNKFSEATWSSVQEALLNDKDVMKGTHGEILRKILQSKEN